MNTHSEKDRNVCDFLFAKGIAFPLGELCRKSKEDICNLFSNSAEYLQEMSLH